ncbi:MAG: hypothetical protein M1305_07700 [Candidatus Marsarchaeota archaeon]|nr:hypothetical protein [Candidatus Marsarchaeota archaeon]
MNLVLDRIARVLKYLVIADDATHKTVAVIALSRASAATHHPDPTTARNSPAGPC